MVNYASGKVYRITSNQTDQVYIGSTCVPLSQRLAKHRSHMRAHAAGKGQVVITSFAVVQYADAVITLIEDHPCENKEQLHRRERFHIEATANCVNRFIPGRTNAEWRRDNREQLTAKAAEKIVCECGAELTAHHIARHLRTAKHMRFVDLLD